MPSNALPVVSGDKDQLLQQAIGHETLDAYETALEQLPEPHQHAVILRIEFGYSFEQIADAVGSPSANAARMTVNRALARLAETMSAYR